MQVIRPMFTHVSMIYTQSLSSIRSRLSKVVEGPQVIAGKARPPHHVLPHAAPLAQAIQTLRACAHAILTVSAAAANRTVTVYTVPSLFETAGGQ